MARLLVQSGHLFYGECIDPVLVIGSEVHRSAEGCNESGGTVRDYVTSPSFGPGVQNALQLHYVARSKLRSAASSAAAGSSEQRRTLASDALANGTTAVRLSRALTTDTCAAPKDLRQRTLQIREHLNA
jgi:hypothetical protein